MVESRAVGQKEKKSCVSKKWKNWCQNEVDEETKGANSRIDAFSDPESAKRAQDRSDMT